MSNVNVPLEQNQNSRILSDILTGIPYSARFDQSIKDNQPNNFGSCVIIP